MADGPAPSANRDLAEQSSTLQAALERATEERDVWAQELFEANRFAAQLTIERQRLVDELATVRERERSAAREEADKVIDAARRERDQARLERDQALVERDQARADDQDATARLQRVTSSTAWRLTGPFRLLFMVLLGRARSRE